MERKRRDQSIFGIHFDFHADPGAPGALPVGGRTTEESIGALIDAVQPDFVQCDCKGHPGWSSYPTKKGVPYPELAGDPMRTWREATAKRGVALYAHYSGVIDGEACRRHPEWARVAPEKVSEGWAASTFRSTSTFGPYVDELLIPQLCELAGDYGLDGIWVDGECWGTHIEYGYKAMELFREKTGADISLHPPVKPGDPWYDEYRDFCREQFRSYLRHYVDAVHRLHPGFQIASNWAFTTLMPEPVTAGVDYLSGDYPPNDSVNSVRFEARYMASQGKPWDLMAWGFHYENEIQFHKSVPQLQQEAAAVISLGGGFQCYLNQRPDGSVRHEQASQLAGVARFCRERQPYCHKASFVPQTALLYCTADHYRVSAQLFQRDRTESVQGMTQLLCEAQHSLEVRSEHGLKGMMSRWPLIVVPELKDMEPDLHDELLQYARGGGNLLLAGPGAVAQLAGELGITLSPRTDKLQFVSLDGAHWAHVLGQSAVMAAPASAETVGLSSFEQDGDGDLRPATAIVPFGAGKIACWPMDVGLCYMTRKAPDLRAVLMAVTDRLYTPMVRITGSMYVDVSVLQKDGRLLIQLVNTAGPHDSCSRVVFDEIPAVGPLTVSVRLPAAPRSAEIVPGGQRAAGSWRNGAYTFTLEKLELHEIVVIDPAK